MDNMTFPEMNSATSSAAGSDILETLNTNLNIFNIPHVTHVDTPKAPMTMQIPRPNQQQQSRLQQSQSQPQSQPQSRQQQPQQQPQSRQQQQPQSRPQQSQQSQQKSVSFNNNVQHKVISPIQQTQQTQQTLKPIQEVSNLTNVTNVTNVTNENSMSITEAAIKLAENEAAVAATATHLIKLGSFKMPKQTLILIGGVVLISVGLFFATRPKTQKKKDIKKLEDDE